jgi:GntR family transcriptional repressor for pyruvate dehydrogenase complex
LTFGLQVREHAGVTSPHTALTPADPDLALMILRPVRGVNAFEATVEQLATAIRLGAFADGDRLPPERALASSLGVSRATLREAIAALRQAGMVTTKSGRGGGTEVTHGAQAGGEDDVQERRLTARDLVEADPARYRDALTVRRVVEPGAAFTAACSEQTDAQRAGLRAAQLDVSRERDPVSYRQADSRFHLAIAGLTGSRRLIELVTEVQRDLHVMLTAIPVLDVNIVHSNDEHARIGHAILTGDADEARRVMEIHCDGSAALLRGLLGMQETTP